VAASNGRTADLKRRDWARRFELSPAEGLGFFGAHLCSGWLADLRQTLPASVTSCSTVWAAVLRGCLDSALYDA
jgi:hypothetical protein